MKLKDADGISIQEAMAQFGLSSDDLGSLIRNPQELLGYLEVHIEQGPILEANDLALGVVSAICEIERHEVNLLVNRHTQELAQWNSEKMH